MGFVGSGPGLVTLLLRVALEGRSLPVVHVEVRVGQVGQRPAYPYGCASVASRHALGADGVGAAHPGARGSRVTASRYALGAEGGGAARPGAYMCSPRNCARSPGGEWGCRRRRALRAAREAQCKACFELLPRARVGWHTARTSVPPPPPRSSGAPVRWLMASCLLYTSPSPRDS